MTFREQRQFAGRWIIVATALLFLLNPLLHLHDHATVPDDGAISARKAAPSSCLACKFQTTVAVEVSEAHLETPAAWQPLVEPVDGIAVSISRLECSPRAPPLTLL